MVGGVSAHLLARDAEVEPARGLLGLLSAVADRGHEQRDPDQEDRGGRKHLTPAHPQRPPGLAEHLDLLGELFLAAQLGDGVHRALHTGIAGADFAGGRARKGQHRKQIADPFGPVAEPGGHRARSAAAGQHRIQRRAVGFGQGRSLHRLGPRRPASRPPGSGSHGPAGRRSQPKRGSRRRRAPASPGGPPRPARRCPEPSARIRRPTPGPTSTPQTPPRRQG